LKWGKTADDNKNATAITGLDFRKFEKKFVQNHSLTSRAKIDGKAVEIGDNK
jgi:hypothetical protein